MLRFLGRRLVSMVVTLLLISFVSFLVIQAPPGDYLTTVVANLQRTGQKVDPAYLAELRQRYALDQPLLVQYWTWISNIVLHGDFGHSFQYGKSVATLLGERLPLTIALGVVTLLLGWAVAFPAGVWSAVRKYSVGDYVLTTLAFIGIGVPGFTIALAVSFLQFRYLGQSVGGLQSPEFIGARWNLGRLLDLLGHVWLPVLVLGLAGVGGTIRVLRAQLLDELRKPYVVTARSKGVPERTLILRYPVRIALNPFISTIGWVLPGLIGGEVIIAKVLDLQTTGPLMLDALMSQDMYLAGSVLFILSTLTVIGTLLSDIVLALVDPRVREGITT